MPLFQPSPFAFLANKNGTDQTGVSSGVATKITMTNEVYDVGNFYDAANSKCVPPAGRRWEFTASAEFTGTITAGNVCLVAIYKNGSIFFDGVPEYAIVLNDAESAVICQDTPNGTDFYEAYALITLGAGTGTIKGGVVLTSFSGKTIT